MRKIAIVKEDLEMVDATPLEERAINLVEKENPSLEAIRLDRTVDSAAIRVGTVKRDGACAQMIDWHIVPYYRINGENQNGK